MGGVFAGTVITQQSGNLTPALCLFLFQPKILSNTGEFVWVGWVVDLALSCVYLNLIILPCTAKTGINDCTLLPMLPFANPILFSFSSIYALLPKIKDLLFPQNLLVLCLDWQLSSRTLLWEFEKKHRGIRRATPAALQVDFWTLQIQIHV